jgi:hypothetical protein
LKPGQLVLLADGQSSPVNSISHHDDILTVYNLSITEIHTFYVGQPGVLVPNSCTPQFANEPLRQQHFDKHVIERGEFQGFGYGSASDYEAGAQRFFTSGQTAYFTRASGDVVHYMAETNEFGVLTAGNVIRTYFQPVEELNYFIAELLKG